MLLSEYISINHSVVAAISGIFFAAIISLFYRLIVLYINEEPYRELLAASFIKSCTRPFCLILIPSIIIYIILLFKFGYGVKLFLSAIFAYAMLLLAAVDFKTQLLPDIITKPLIAIGLVQGYFNIFTDIKTSLLGAFFGYFVLWLVNRCFRLVRGIDGMGYGDFKLLSAIGAWTGVKMLPLTILFSSILGIFVALIIIKTTKQEMQAPTPFGPSLVITGFIVFLYGNDILVWYLSMLQAG